MIADAPVAQRIEHRIPNPGVAGSTPARRVFFQGIQNDKISVMAYPFFPVLATGIAGPYPVSNYMVAFSSFPPDRHYYQRRLRSS